MVSLFKQHIAITRNHTMVVKKISHSMIGMIPNRGRSSIIGSPSPIILIGMRFLSC